MASKVLRDVVIFFNQDDTALKKIATRLGATVCYYMIDIEFDLVRFELIILFATGCRLRN